MNREQAGHILDAYVQSVKFIEDGELSQSLREVILDAMTGYKTEKPGWSGYGITVPTTGYPNDWDCIPKVTCSTHAEPCTASSELTSGD